ncbi:hypothetical protein G7054_g13038 [Neopestalotiopsis clavispora]|nr:hypothetical protein G7054_g13038 [Neopestalotiopsis clavispora]
MYSSPLSVVPNSAGYAPRKIACPTFLLEDTDIDEHSVEEEEEVDAVSLLPSSSKHPQGRSRGRERPPTFTYDEDFTRYVVQRSSSFKFGTVFKAVWSEPMPNARLSKRYRDPFGTGTSISEFGQRNINGTTLYEGIRRFIVVDGMENGSRNGNSICVPIATYKKQGCTKHGVKPQHHGIIYTHDKTPMLLNGEPELGYNPIRLVVNRDLQGLERLAPESRINYSKHVTIEHNTAVHIIGQIHADDLEALEIGVDSAWRARVGNRKIEKDKKPAKDKEHTSSQSYLSKDESSNSAKISPKLSDGIRQAGHRPDHGPADHSGFTYRPVRSKPDYYRDKSTKDGGHSSFSQTVGQNSAGKQQEAHDAHASGGSHVAASDAQDPPEELDSRLDSLTISSSVIRDRSLNAEDAEVRSAGNASLPNSPHSPVSSICLTETTPDTSATGPPLITAQRRQILVQRLIVYVTNILQARTGSRGQNTRVHTESSGRSARGNATTSDVQNQATQSNSGSGQPIRPNRKRAHRQQSSEDGSDGDARSPGRESKDKQKEPQAPFACPYVKHYGPQASCNGSSNHNKGWPNSARVKEHLYRHHLQPIHCPRCHIKFGSEDALDTHIREQKELCVLSDRAPPGGLNKKQKNELRSRTGLSKMTECDKWRKIYRILFPDTQDQIPSPYFDSNDYHEPLAGLNANLRQEIARRLAYHVTKKLKATHREDGRSELNEAFFIEVMDDVWRTCSSTYNEHIDGEGNGNAADDPAVEALLGIAFDDDTNDPIPSLFEGFDDLHTEPSVEQTQLSMFPNWDPNDFGLDYVEAFANYHHDTGVDELTSDSGYSSKKSQEAQESISEDGDIGCSKYM